MFKKSFYQKLAISFLLLSLTFILVSPALLVPQPVRAVSPFVAIINTAKTVWDATKDVVSAAYKRLVPVLFKNGINLVLNNMARDTAKYLASGGAGEKPAFLTDPHYWTKMGDAAGGEFINTLAQSTGFINQSLCDPIDPTIKLKMLTNLNKNLSKETLLRNATNLDKTIEGIFDPEKACSLSKINQRLKEASKKKLFAFDTELREGSLKKYLTDLTVLISTDPKILDTPAKEDLQIICGVPNEDNEYEYGLANQQVIVQDIVEQIKAISDKAKESEKTAIKNKIKDVLAVITLYRANKEEIKANHYPQRIVDGNSVRPLDYYSKVSQYCLTLNEESLLEAEEQEYFECSKLYYSDDSSCAGASYSSCTDAWKRIKLYSNQAIKWQEQLTQLTESLIDKDGKLVLPNESVATSLADMQKMLSPENSDIGIELSMASNLDSFITNKVTDKQTWDQINTSGGITSMNTAISNIVKTPSALVKKAGEKNVENADTSLKTYTGDLLADTANVFMGTLMSQLVKQIFEKGFNEETNPDSVTSENKTFTTISNLTKEPVNTLFTGLSRVNLKQGGQVDVLKELMLCPENAAYQQVNNCVIDQRFAQAIQQQKTIKQAEADGDIDLILDKNNIDEILTKIKILRANRIVPLGLEIAANLMKQNDPSLFLSQYSLKQLIDEFDDDQSPFYHLVDPNWVLKAPASRCQIMGYGNLPLYGSNERQEVCLDRQNCIDEAEDGSCLTYGYCVAEKKIWRFQGDSCDQQFSSCLGYQRQTDGQSAYYLADTLDNQGCDAQNAGCQQYTLNYAINSGSWIDHVDANIGCPYPGGCRCQIPALGSCVVPEGSTSCTIVNENDCNLTNPYYLYFNRQAETCSAKSVGCHEYLRNQADLGTNLILNNSFTDFVGDTNDETEDVFAPWERQGINSAGQSMTDIYAVSDGYQDQQAIKIVTEQQEIVKGIAQTIVITPQDYARYFTALVYIKNQENFTGIWNLLIQSDSEETIIADDNQWDQDNYDWQRYWQTIEVPTNTNEITLFIGTSFQDSTAQGSILVDGVQLVETSQPIINEFDLPALTDYGQINQVYLRQSPAEIDCDLNSDDYNSLACDDYALTCQPADVGCQFYSSAVGTTKIPAVVNPNDVCPAECVGYDDYYQSATLFENSIPIVPLIPNGETCLAQEVGCEEFTNLEKLAQGGEAKEYYSYIRPCQKLNDTCQAYYTWVGSDDFGYQLKKYVLRAGTTGPAKVSIDDTVYGKCDNETDATINPHCRIFYNNAGQIYPTIFEATITCSENCQQLRKTTQIDLGDCWTDFPDSASYNSTTGICTFSALSDQSRSCSASSVGCREYKGNNANQVVNILSDDFESGNLDNWNSGEISSESVHFPGSSLYLTNLTNRSLEINKIIVGRSYLVTFWAKGNGNLDISFDNSQSFGSVDLKNQWQSYRLGPVIVGSSLSVPTNIVFSGFTNLYLDNFVLQQNSNLYFIKDSWQIPESCIDSTLGCQTYYDATKQTHYLTGFSHLCSDQAVGCEEMVDTHNSSRATEFTFNQDATDDLISDNITIPADNKVYLVNDAQKYCLSVDKGCQQFGLASYNNDGQISGYQDVYLKNNPDKYNSDRSILCREQQQNCTEFKPIGNAGNSVYFKDPTANNQLCEYREGVVIAGQSLNGWFEQGTNQACYDNYNIKNSNEAGYSNQVGICPSQQASCTKFTDPDADQNYYYLKNNQLDETSCQGQVSKKEGCILFNDNSNPYNYYDSKSTYENNLSEELVIPVNGDENNDTNIILKVRPDRVCAQWEWCKNSFVQQLDGGQTQAVCSQLGLCNQLIGHGNNAQCVGWETDSPFLDKDYYTDERKVSYAGGIDYSGIAIADQYLPDQLQINYNQDNNYFYLDSVIKEGVNGVSCSSNNDCLNGSICQDNKCILLPATRAYTEKDAPFTNSMWDIYHQQVNYCQSNSCQDSYYKVGYGTKGMEKRYFDVDETIFNYVCSELDTDNKAVNCEKNGEKNDSICSDDDLGTCMAKSAMTEEKVANWSGYCLERAPNYDQRVAPCLTWLPINIGMDEDLHNPNTGYSPLPNQQWYCVAASDDERRDVSLAKADENIYDILETWSGDCYNENVGSSYTENWSSCPCSGNGIYTNKDDCHGSSGVEIHLNKTPLTTLPYFVVKQVNNLTYEKNRFFYQYPDAIYNKRFSQRDSDDLRLDRFKMVLSDLNASTLCQDALKINTRPCQTLVKVPVNENGMAVAYTNRINNLQYPSIDGKRLRIYDNSGIDSNGISNSQSLYQDLAVANISLVDAASVGALYYRQHPDWDGTNDDNYQLYDWLGSPRGYVTKELPSTSLDAYHFADLFPQEEQKVTLDWDTAEYTSATVASYPQVITSDPSVEFSDNMASIPIGLSYQLGFYASADANRMPIQKIKIDWGDEIQTLNSLTAMNHKKVREVNEEGEVVEEGCNNMDFGSLAEQTCVERPFIFQHAYTKLGIFTIEVTVWDNWANILESSGMGITTAILSASVEVISE